MKVYSYDSWIFMAYNNMCAAFYHINVYVYVPVDFNALGLNYVHVCTVDKTWSWWGEMIAWLRTELAFLFQPIPCKNIWASWVRPSVQEISMHLLTILPSMPQMIGTEMNPYTHDVKGICHHIEAVQTAIWREAQLKVFPHMITNLSAWLWRKLSTIDSLHLVLNQPVVGAIESRTWFWLGDGIASMYSRKMCCTNNKPKESALGPPTPSWEA